MESSSGVVVGDKYRSYLHGEGEKNTKLRFGAPPNYDVVNKLFEQGRTQIWSPGSLEEMVQNLMKTYEMELFHKACPEDCKSVDPNKFTLSLNGRKAFSLGELQKLGGYNALLQTSIPEELRLYNPADETAESSHKAFTTTFPRGFTVEVLHVYSGPPVIVYKFRHWGYMEGPFKGHAPTGELAQFYGMAIFEVDDRMRVVKVEFFYDPAELLGPLTKSPKLDTFAQMEASASASSCPVLRNTG